MECPRCGSRLDTYTLGGREAVGCDSCGYVGVPVEHRGEKTDIESWNEAISRYAASARHGSVTVETVDGEPALELMLDEDAGSDSSSPPLTTIRIDDPDPALAAAFEAADGTDERFACEICGSTFDSQSALYGHLASHSGGNSNQS